MENRFVKSFFSQPYLILTMTSVSWASNAIAGRLTVGEISPLMVVFLRWLLAALVLFALYHREIFESWTIIRPRLLQLALMGASGLAIFHSLFYIAANHTTAINLGIISGAVPVMVLLGMFLVYSARITVLQIVGTVLTIVGVIFLAIGGNLFNLLDLNISIGDGLMIIGCIFFAAYTIALKNQPPLSGIVMMTMLAIFACIASIPGAIFEVISGHAKMPTGYNWLLLGYIAFVPTLMAELFYLRGVELIGPARAGIFINLVPIFAAILAVLVLSESFQLFHAISLVLVLVGIYIAERKVIQPHQ